MESPCFSRPQSTASHLFARTRSFHRPTYKRPGAVEVWNRDFRSLGLVNSRRIRSPTENNKVTRDETSHFFRHMSLPVGGNGNKMRRRGRKSKCGFRDARSNCSSEIIQNVIGQNLVTI